jgi:hypothetical protein
VKTLNKLKWTQPDGTEHQAVFSSSSSSLLAMSNGLMAEDASAVAASTFTLVLDVDLSHVGSAEDTGEVPPENASHNLRMLLVKVWPYLTSRNNPMAVVEQIQAAIPISIPLSAILPPEPSATIVAITVWRLVNAWTWCLLPSRRKLSRSALSRSTWDAISLNVDPSTLARNPEDGHVEPTTDGTVDPESVIYVPTGVLDSVAGSDED